MRGVSKTWEQGFDYSITSLKIWSCGPLLPENAPVRFLELATQGLGASTMPIDDLSSLARFKKLTAVSLAFDMSEPRMQDDSETLHRVVTDESLIQLRDLHLTSLDLSQTNITGAGLVHLRVRQGQ